MPVVYLTDVVVSRLKEPGTYFDETTPAFGIRVGKNRKTWIVIRGRERVRTRIGRYPAVSLAKARKQALVLLGSPVEQKVEVPKFADAIQQFYAIHVTTMKPKTRYQIKRVIKRYFDKPLQHTQAVAHDQHAHHQFGIDRRPTDGAVEGSQLPPQLSKLDEPVDRPQQMIGRNVSFERKLVEQSSLIDLPMSHHDLQSCLSQRLNQRISSRATADFFNKVDPKRPS